MLHYTSFPKIWREFKNRFMGRTTNSRTVHPTVQSGNLTLTIAKVDKINGGDKFSVTCFHPKVKAISPNSDPSAPNPGDPEQTLRLAHFGNKKAPNQITVGRSNFLIKALVFDIIPIR
jgi:hypothetical protein